MDATYSQGSNVAALAGLILVILSKLGVTTDLSTVMAIIGGIIGLYGIIRQIIAHKSLKDAAVLAGVSIRK